MYIHIPDGTHADKVIEKLKGRLSRYQYKLEQGGLPHSTDDAIESYILDCDCSFRHVKQVLRGREYPDTKLLESLERTEWQPDEPIYVPKNI